MNQIADCPLPARAVKHARVSKPPTSNRAKAAAQRRKEELLAVLAVRGAPIADRRKLTDEQRSTAAAYFKAADAYLKKHDDFAWKQAHRVLARHVPVDDLVQAARIGLVKALDKFDRSRVEAGTVTSFLTYARWWVRCEMGRVLDDESLVRVPTTARRLASAVRDAGADGASDDEIGVLLGVDSQKVRQHRDVYMGNDRLSIGSGRRRSKNGEAAGEEARAVVLAMRKQGEAVAQTRESCERELELTVAIGRLSAMQRRLISELYGLELDSEAMRVVLPASEAARRALTAAAVGRLRAELS